MFYILVLFLFMDECFGLTPQCRDENGEPVDWFYVYKLPKEKNHINPRIRTGEAYMYIVPWNLTNGWIMSDRSVRDPMSMVGRTLAPLYQNPKNDTISVIYNDQPPIELRPDFHVDPYKKTQRAQTQQRSIESDYNYYEIDEAQSKLTKSNESGHTKGVVLGDKTTGIWLVHSVPKFPPIPSGSDVTYNYPLTGLKFGQAMLCVTVQTSTLNQIAIQLKYNEPEILHYNLPKQFHSELPNLVDVVLNKTVEAAPWYHIQNFESLTGRKFLSFAKSGNFHDDLYSGLVAGSLQSDLLVETWINGPGTLDPECHRKFQVRNVEQLNFLKAKMSTTSHHDHSKWVVTVPRKRSSGQDRVVDNYWVCVGDINRALSQETRGGGTVCTSGPILWGNFVNLVKSAQACNSSQFTVS